MNESEEVQRHKRMQFQKFLSERIAELDAEIAKSNEQLDELEDKIVANQMRSLMTDVEQALIEAEQAKYGKSEDGTEPNA